MNAAATSRKPVFEPKQFMNVASLHKTGDLRIIHEFPNLEEFMPRRIQNGKLLTRKDVSRPYYYVKVTVPRINTAGERKKQRVEEPCGFLDEVSRDEAMMHRAAVLQTVNNRRTLAASVMRFRDLSARYVAARLPTLGVATQAGHRIQIKKHLDPYFGSMKLSDIDRPSVEQFLASKHALSWWSRVKLKGVLSAIFTAAKDWKCFEGDMPTERIRIGKKKAVYEKRLLTVDQLRLILAGLDQECRFLVQLLLGTGLGISEALGLRWSDVDLVNGTVTVSRRWWRGDLSEEGTLKNDNRGGIVPLGGMLAAEMQSRKEAPGDFIFTIDGKIPYDDRDLLRERFRPVVKRLGLYYKGFGWHAFRRQNITWRQTIGGATPMEAQKAARHGSLDMTFLYFQRDHEREGSQVDAIFDKLMEGAKPC